MSVLAGGPNPYWLGCDYPVFTAFLIVNGVAFVLSVASAIVVTAFPLLLRRNPHQAAYWGGTLLLLSLIAFIVAFLLAGFVTVAYKAPAPGCAALTCEDGGVVCSTAVINTTTAGFYLLDPNQAALNNLGTNGTDAICLRYSTAVAINATTMTLIPALVTCPGTNINSDVGDFLNCTAVRDLLEDDRVGQEVLCTSASNFPSQLPTTDTTNYTIPFATSLLQGHSSLAAYYDANPLNYVTDLFSDTNQQGLQAYAGFSYTCYSRENDTSKAFNPLCDTTQQPALSVTKSGQYMTEATASTSGARVFRVDITSMRVAHALEALTGFFGLVLLLIFGYLITARTSY